MAQQQDNALINDLMEQVLFLVSHPTLNAEEINQVEVDQLFAEVRQNIWHVLSEKLDLDGRELDEQSAKAVDAIIYVVTGLGQSIGDAADDEARLALLNKARGEVWYVVENHILAGATRCSVRYRSGPSRRLTSSSLSCHSASLPSRTPFASCAL
mgnify:CR=1 FL=1